MGDSSYFNWGFDLTVNNSTNTKNNNATSNSNSNNNSNNSNNIDDIFMNMNPYNPTALKVPLPQTAQVAAQQGAYLARLLNRGYDLSESLPRVEENNLRFQISRFLRRKKGDLYAKPFSFLNLGLLAYIGDEKAVAQMQLGDFSSILFASGTEAFLIWRSVYLVKQVSARTRFLVLFDFIKTKVFGRDFSGL
jgi:NADH dehydrogenase FAD-containing subunit